MTNQQENWEARLDKLIEECNDGQGSYSPDWSVIKAFISDLLTKEADICQMLKEQAERLAQEKGYEDGFEAGRASLKAELREALASKRKFFINGVPYEKDIRISHIAAIDDLLSLLDQVK